MSQPAYATARSTQVIPTGTWQVDPDHTRVGFVVKHLGIDTIRGQFTEFEGALEVDDDMSRASAGGSVSAASIFTNQPRRDEHLRSPDFFDAARYPAINFTSTLIETNADGSFNITGELTMHGVTRELVLRAVVQGTDIDPFGNERVGLEVTGKVSRADYGMTFNLPVASGALFVGDEVTLVLDVGAIKQS
jgi:polyisoprenoid-binding protein YceI